jgi:integrase
MVLLGFAGAFRRSELIALDLDDCAFGGDGLTINLRRSKTDQQGTGRNRHVREGRLSPIDVARVVKKLAVRAGLDPAKYAGHSLRAGHATSATPPN